MLKMTLVAASLTVAALAPGTAHAQCARMVGSGQIICPGYANSTSPVYTGRGYYQPGRGAYGAGQMAFGTGTAIWNARRGNPQALQYSAGTVARGYNNFRNYPLYTYQPRMAYPAARPRNFRW
jgi:hypothetical protein